MYLYCYNYLVLQCGIETLKIENLICVGHYNCGAVKLAYDITQGEDKNTNNETLSWLKPIISLIKANK